MDMIKRNIFSILNIFLIFFVIIMVSGAGIKEAWAYFTTYAQAKGGYRFEFGYETYIQEEVSNWEKRVVISSKPNSQPVYIRARAFCGSEYTLTYSGDGWTLGNDGYYYYDQIVYGGGATSELVVKIENIPQNTEDSPEFNVVVIYESTPVTYDENGNPKADWSAVLDSGRTEGGN